MMNSSRAVLLVSLLFALGCEKPQRYTTTAEIIQVQRFGQDPVTAPHATDVELKFVECPGDARKVMRGDKVFSLCAAKLKKGDKATVELVSRWVADKGGYRSEIVKLNDCDVKIDPTDEANWEIVQDCKDLEASGATVGVRCERKRSKELVAKCPWLRRN
jgi:hypothetical protein